MARRSLTSLIEEQTTEPSPPPRPELVQTEPVTTEVPNYLRLVRKETRLTEEQYSDLTSLARRLNRQREQRTGERITENTLIRAAVDALLTQAENLHGETEAELTQSLTTRLRK